MEKVAEGQYKLVGELSLSGLNGLLGQPIEAVDGVASVDLSGLTDSDSAAAALMVSWARRAAGHDESVQYVNCPEKLMALLELYDLPPVLGIL